MNEHIEEMQVTIKVLRIGKKQFTKSLLNQLPYGDAFDSINSSGVLNKNVIMWGYCRVSHNIVFIFEYDHTLYYQECDDNVDNLMSIEDAHIIIDRYNIPQIFIGI